MSSQHYFFYAQGCPGPAFPHKATLKVFVFVHTLNLQLLYLLKHPGSVGPFLCQWALHYSGISGDTNNTEHTALAPWYCREKTKILSFTFYAVTFFCIRWNFSATHCCAAPTATPAPHLPQTWPAAPPPATCLVSGTWRPQQWGNAARGPTDTQPSCTGCGIGPSMRSAAWISAQFAVGLYHRCKTLQGIHHYLGEQVISFPLNVQHLLQIQYWTMTVIHLPFPLFSLGYRTAAAPQSFHEQHPAGRAEGSQRQDEGQLCSLFPAAPCAADSASPGLHDSRLCTSWSTAVLVRMPAARKPPPHTAPGPWLCLTSCYCLVRREAIHHLHGEPGRRLQ